MDRPKFYADHGERMTIAEIVAAVGEALDNNDVNGACDALDYKFIYGCWNHILDPKPHEHDGPTPTSNGYAVRTIALSELHKLNRDIRGLIVAAYNLGKSRR